MHRFIDPVKRFLWSRFIQDPRRGFLLIFYIGVISVFSDLLLALGETQPAVTVDGALIWNAVVWFLLIFFAGYTRACIRLKKRR